MSQLIIGLTGGIGSGKTAVSDRFAALGIDVVDADVIARDVVANGTLALKQIAQKFGPQVLLPSGELNRAALRQQVFANSEAKDWLNALLHPLIREQMLQQCQQAASDYVILSVPLLIENGLNRLCHRVLVVDVPEDIQLARASARDNNSEAEIRAIMAAQSPRDHRLQLADDIIDNSGPLDALAPQVDKLHTLYTDVAKNLGKT